jgi:transcriptional regulator with XRE-family HTH domain
MTGTQARTRRQKLQMTQATAAQAIGVSRVALNRFEMGHSELRHERLERLKAVLLTPVERSAELLGKSIAVLNEVGTDVA